MATQDIVIELRRLDNAGALKGFADATVPTPFGEVTVRGFRVIQKDGQEPWVALPTSGYMKNGQRVNAQLLDLPRSLKKQLQERREEDGTLGWFTTEEPVVVC